MWEWEKENQCDQMAEVQRSRSLERNVYHAGTDNCCCLY